MNSVHAIGVSRLIKASNDSEIIYELKPNINTYFKLKQYTTNFYGLRDKEYTIEKPENIFRVAVIGDSYTQGSGVSINNTYHSILEGWYNNEQNDLTYQFINFGVGGYSLRQYLRVVTLKANHFNPDLIILGFTYRNDHHIPNNEIFEKPYQVKTETKPFFESFIITTIKRFIYVYKLRKSQSTVFDDGTDFTENEKKYVGEIFSSLSAYSSVNRIPIIIVNLSYIYDEKYVKELESIASNNNLYFIDVSKSFIGKDRKQYYIYSIDQHPNADANRIFAKQLYDYLNRMKFTNWVRGFPALRSFSVERDSLHPLN